MRAHLPVLLFFILLPRFVYAVGIQITKNRDLAFLQAAPGDGSAVVIAGNAGSSKFTVTGNAGATFDITFPSGTINMVNGASTIGTTTWTSDLTTPGTLDGTGTAVLYIGATHDALGGGLGNGTYTGSHSVSVQYTGAVGPIRTAAADHTLSVISSISVSKSSDLSFPDAARGDAGLTIAPGISSAVFSVSGHANTVYTITLPNDGVVTMETGGGGSADNIIGVNSFASNPSGTGTTDGAGNQTLYVGATRAAISGTQTQASNYTGSFNITVTYQ